MITLKRLLSVQMICKMFVKILKNTKLEKKRKGLIFFHDMIADVINNKQLNSVVTELFIRGRKLTFQLPLLCNHTLKCQMMFN